MSKSPCYNRIVFLFILFLFSQLSSGCSLTEEKAQEVMANKNTISELGSTYRTKAIDQIENWAPGTYYSNLSVTAESVPSAIGRCSKPSDLFNSMKLFFGINDVSEILITAKVIANGNTIIEKIPLLLVAYYDEGPNGLPYCVTNTFSGTLTPDFIVNSDLNLNIEYEISYANTKKINTANKIIDYGMTISSFVNMIPVGNLSTNLIKPITDSVDYSLTNSFSSVSNDIMRSEFKTKVPIGSKRYDAFKINLGKSIKPEQVSLQNMAIKVEMNYVKTVFGLKLNNTDKYIYPNNPKQILNKVDSQNNNNIAFVVENNLYNGLSRSSLKSIDTNDEINEMLEACNAINSYISNILGLSELDTLIAKWAILKEYSNYDSNYRLRNDVCFTKKEIEQLYSLNVNYIFFSPEKISEDYVTETLNSLSQVIHRKISADKMMSLNNFTLSIHSIELIEKTYLPEELKNESTININGEEALNLLSKIIISPRCGSVTLKNRNSISSDIAFIFKLKSINNESKFAPAVINFNQDKVESIWILPTEILRSVKNVTNEWPEKFENPNCKNTFI